MAERNGTKTLFDRIKPLIDSEIEKRTRSCCRTKSMVVTTAYNADTQTVGVSEAAGNEINIPVCGNVDVTKLTVGTPVWVFSPYSSMSNAIVFMLGDGETGYAASAGNANELGGKESAYYLNIANVVPDGAGAHNAVYRGKNLGTAVTAGQYAAIADGTFRDLFIGDYWIINNVTYRIAAFDYYYLTGDTACTTHHVTLVPDASMYVHAMNDTNITTGGYVGSKMYTDGLEQAKTTINIAFGAAHVLTHRQYLCNAVTNGKPSGGSWYDSKVELMTEQNCYGGKVFGEGNDGSTVPALYTVDKSKYPLFAFRPDMISNRQWFWLRDVVSAAVFASVDNYGTADRRYATTTTGVRPAFSIIG